MKTPPEPHTPELVRSSPFFPRVAFTLREKMAHIQSQIDVAENDACDPTPAQDSGTGGGGSTQDYLSDGISGSEGKENNPPTSPRASKKRRLGPLVGCSVEITEEDISIARSSLTEQEDAICKQQSPSPPPRDDPAAVSPARQSSLHISSLPSLLEMKPTVDVDETTVARKKKQVRFGGPLSPELFDKNLPPSTPLQKGATPARAATPAGGWPLRSVLKTPQRSESDAQLQAERLTPAWFGASPTFAIPGRHRRSHERDDDQDGKIVFPPMEEIDSAVSSDADCVFDAQPLNLNMDFQEETLSQNPTVDTEPKRASETEAMDEQESVAEERQPEGEAESETPTQSRNGRRTKKEEQSEMEAGTRRGTRKRKQPEDSEPVKKSTRSAAKSACRKMKVASAARRWNKDVDRSLYSSRQYASKNPGLSPIKERMSFTLHSLTVQQTPESAAATHQGSGVQLQVADGSLHREEIAEAKAEENLSLPTCSPGKQSGQLRSRVRGRPKKGKVSAADCEELQEEVTEQRFELQSSVSLGGSQGTPRMSSQQSEADPDQPSDHISVHIQCTDSSECDAGLLAPTSSSAPLGDKSNDTEPAVKKAKRGRKSSASLYVHAKEPQPSSDGEGGQAEREQDNTQSSSEHEGEPGEPHLDLAPWQSDFNFEDVFKAVPSRRRRSVRRSLRNQATLEPGSVDAGLAWVPHCSPDSFRETRRSSRRRLSAALAVPPQTHDSSSNEPRAKEEDL
ncbi:cell division cycle-associated protein 2 [Fundulus heteroclitus]|uniref:cell division cycle-associated protein 2 n=1 Tax=Fundulus heteroclitus TaxID=8078 RepID=UPI00165C95AB|nr:cell division cycle-associated protein 2 [Fundulus heteroclitus]